MDNFLTFDIEEWYHANYAGVRQNKQANKYSRLDWQVKTLLELCEQYAVRATFFVVGEVAIKRKGLIKSIAQAGHEIASHGNHHRLVWEMTAKEFTKDLNESVNILEQITGKKVRGFRAPSWSINKQIRSWYYQVLAENQIKYSSSVFPVSTPLYGIPDATQAPHLTNAGVWEVPASVTKIAGKNWGFAGGFYLRILPFWAIRKFGDQLNRAGKPIVFYLHPREIDSLSPRMQLPLIDSWIHYLGVNGALNKIAEIISCQQASLRLTMGEVFSQNLNQIRYNISQE
ncbi:MAG: polysaccharide deacetylase family protein [bacterium]